MDDQRLLKLSEAASLLGLRSGDHQGSRTTKGEFTEVAANGALRKKNPPG